MCVRACGGVCEGVRGYVSFVIAYSLRRACGGGGEAVGSEVRRGARVCEGRQVTYLSPMVAAGSRG
jgi:hypothetical protein